DLFDDHLGVGDLRLLQTPEGVDADGAHQHADDGHHHHDLDQRHTARRQPTNLPPRLPLHDRPPQLTNSFISMIGDQIEKTTNATEPPIKRIITGSSNVVKHPIFKSTSWSYADATFSSICSSCPERSPTAIMCVTMGGNSPERLSGAAIDSPSLMDSLASSMTFIKTVLPRIALTISKARSSGTPEDSMVASVFAKRVIAICRASGPMIGSLRMNRSRNARPRGELLKRR